jgi:hypothetical protein
VSGPPRIGKSVSLKALMAQYERGLRARHPDYFLAKGDDYIPVAYLQTPEKASVKSLLQTLAMFYELEVSSRITTTELQHLVTKAMNCCGTSILVIDDLHFLDVSERSGQEANDMLKSLANTTGATFVAVGVDLEDGQLFTEGRSDDRGTQTSGRYSLLTGRRFSVATKRDATEWVDLVNTFEKHLVLLDQPPYSIAQHWEHLHARTSGSICSLSLLLREAAFVVQGTDDERITEELLDTVTVDYASEHAFQLHLEGLNASKNTVARRNRTRGARLTA